MKLLTYSMIVTFRENGQYCWKVRWKEKSKEDIASSLAYGMLLNIAQLVILLIVCKS